MMTVQKKAKEYFDVGMECYKNKDFGGAITNFSQAIIIEPNYEKAYLHRGRAYQKLQKNEDAIYDYEQAIRINPNYAKAYFLKGSIYEILEEYEKAIDDYSRAIEKNSNDVQSYFNRATLYNKLKKYKEAINDYNQAIEKDCELKEAYYDICILYIKLKDLQNAKKNFKKFIEFIGKLTFIEELTDDNLNMGLSIIPNDILYFIINIALKDLIDDSQKLILLELIYYCYQLMDKIKFQEDTFKLIHYTKTGSLKFLLKKKADFGKLRLNNAIYMNDPQEGQIFKNVLSKYRKNKLHNIFHNDIDIKNYTYLTCFCPDEKRDTLPMWVHYGDGGKGIGLVFNEKFFENQELYKVQYIDTENFNIYKIDKSIRKEFKQIFNFLAQDIFVKNENKQFLEYTSIIIDYISYFFKDKAYKYECEIRMVQFRDYESEDIIINEASDIPKLCIEYDKEITTENCEEIIVGPKGSLEEIETYRKYVGMKKPCTKSKIQYR